MDETAIRKYLAQDFAKAVAFYDARAQTSKRCYRVLTVYVIIVSAALAPVLAFAPDEVVWRVISASLSSTIVVATGLLAHLKCHENWLSYRASWDALERERRLFESEVGVYRSAADKGQLFVAHVEEILAREGSEFYSRHARRDEHASTSAK